MAVTECTSEFTYPIVEIFVSIQGEGWNMGRLATFIRLAGCNLNCNYCDTPNRKIGYNMTIRQILDKIEIENHPGFIVLTGGEPTIHDLQPLLIALKHTYPSSKIAIETNGTGNLSRYAKYIDWITCSPKGPVYEFQSSAHELKYVVTRDFNVDVIPYMYMKHAIIWLQPNQKDMQWSIQKCCELVMEYPQLRLGVQLHYWYKLK